MNLSLWRCVLMVVVGLFLSACGVGGEATESVSPETTVQPTVITTAESADPVSTPTNIATQTDEALLVTATLPPTRTPTASPTPDIEVTPFVVAPDEDIVIGFAASFTGDAATVFGMTLQHGVELALGDRPTVTIDDVEFTVTLDVQDDLCTAEGGAQVANTFIGNQSVVAVIGPMCDDACAAAMPILDAARYTSISASCAASALTQVPSYSFNRTIPSAQSEGQVTADFLYNTVGARQIAIWHDDSPQGIDLADVVMEVFESFGGEVVVQQAVRLDDDPDTVLMQVANSELDAVYYAGFADVGEGLVIGRADAGLDTVSFVVSSLLFDTDFIARTGDAAEGLIVMRVVPPTSRLLDVFETEYVETYGEEPVTPFAAYAYDATQIILDAIEAVGEIDDSGALVIDREALNDYIRNLEGYDGLTGELNCNETGECAASVIEINVVQEGVFIPLTDE